jgi:hypothetical protein
LNHNDNDGAGFKPVTVKNQFATLKQAWDKLVNFNFRSIAWLKYLSQQPNNQGQYDHHHNDPNNETCLKNISDQLARGEHQGKNKN